MEVQPNSPCASGAGTPNPKSMGRLATKISAYTASTTYY